MNDNGEVVAGVLVVVASAATTGAVLAVSDAAANNATFTVAIFTIIAGLLGAATWLNKRVENRITRLIDERTRPIQPDANGGKSLADLHHKIDANAEADQLWRLGVGSMMRDFANRLDRIEGESRD